VQFFPIRKIDLTPEDFATAVRAARRNQHLRQDQLAAAANVGVRFIVDLEAGKPTAQLGKTLAVLNALGLHVSLSDSSISPRESGS
jgi:y4mF family transcriptional regulator